ncbi:sulfite exporter TauE/SafE family protein [Phycisphaeraceae bacterium D3-23]
MDLTTLCWLALIMLTAGAVQAAVGFGAGMFATPLMLLLGLSLPEAIGVLSSGVLVQGGYKTWHYRREVPWGFVWPMVWARLAGYGPGFVALYWLSGAGKQVVKPVIGGFILLALSLQVLMRTKPRAHVARGWTWVAGFASGLFAGAVGMGGPPVVLWVVSHDWPALRARVFLWANFFVLMPVAMLALGLIYGRPVWIAMGWGLVLVPAVMLGTAGGLWLGHRIPRRELRWAMIGLLVVLALTSIVGPMV